MPNDPEPHDVPMLPEGQSMPGQEWFARNILESLQRLQSGQALGARSTAEVKESVNLIKQEVKHLSATLDLRFQENERRIGLLEVAAKAEADHRAVAKLEAAVDRNNTRWITLVGGALISLVTALTVKFWPP